MGTNYYRIPKAEEVKKLREDYMKRITDLSDYSFCTHFPKVTDAAFNAFDGDDPYKIDWNDEEGNAFQVHLGKSSYGWQFLWNFHRNKFYSNKEELLAFIRSGRVFDEYGVEQDIEEFIHFAFVKKAEGLNSETYENKSRWELDWHDTFIDGLRVSTPSRESTFFS